MGNTVTQCTCCETVSDRLPWIQDPFMILKRMPSRTIVQPHRYQKDSDEEDQSSERESEKSKNEQ